MFFDALTLAAARDEMLETLLPGRVQQVRAVGPLAIGLEIYGNGRRRHLLLSAHAQHARAHLLSKAPTRDPGVRTPFLLLLRKYIRGAILQSIEQPEFERVLVFTFTKVLPVNERDAPEPEEADEDEALDDRLAAIPPGFALFETRLIAEIMGRHSNVVMVDAGGEIMDAIKRIPPSLNRVRTTLPHVAYAPPPAQRKLDVTVMDEASFAREVRALKPEAPLWQGFVSLFRSVSPLLAQEAVFRATGNAATATGEADLSRAFDELVGLLTLAETAEWDPTLAVETAEEVEGEQVAEAAPLAFAPYPLQHLQATGAELQPTPSISHAAEVFYAAAEQISGHAQLKADVLGEIREQQDKLERRARSLQIEIDRAAGFEVVRQKAELLLAYMYSIEPGQKELVIPEENLLIALDPDRTPLEQAQGMFRQYQRARAAVEGVPARLEATQLALNYLDELATALDLAEDYETIQTVRADLRALPGDEPGAPREAPEEKRPAKQQKRDNRNARKKNREEAPAGRAAGARPVQVRSRDGVQILYGRSARENDALTFGVARPGDLWLHARGVPGSHVVVRTEGRASVPESTVAEAARLAARHSKARNAGAVDVVVTERRHVRRIPGAPPGLVTYSDERVLRVRVDDRPEA